MRRFSRLAHILALAAAIGFASLALIASAVFAQTMGEYGMAVGHAATSSSSMPRIAPPPLPSQPSAGANPGGATHTEEVQTYDEPAASDANEDKDTSSDKSNGDNWTQVR